jgi:hypothetical protein
MHRQSGAEICSVEQYKAKLDARSTAATSAD